MSGPSLSRRLCGSLVTGAVLSVPGIASAPAASASTYVVSKQVPFVQNVGQLGQAEASFYAKLAGGAVFVTDGGELVYSLGCPLRGDRTGPVGGLPHDDHDGVAVRSTLEYGSYLGGSGEDLAHAVAVSGAGDTYVAGETTSADFPTTVGAFDRSYNGGTSDAFMSKFDTSPPGGRDGRRRLPPAAMSTGAQKHP